MFSRTLIIISSVLILQASSAAAKSPAEQLEELLRQVAAIKSHTDFEATASWVLHNPTSEPDVGTKRFVAIVSYQLTDDYYFTAATICEATFRISTRELLHDRSWGCESLGRDRNRNAIRIDRDGVHTLTE